MSSCTKFFQPSFPCFTWDCADELEGRLKKTLYHGGKNDCMAAVSPVALTGRIFFHSHTDIYVISSHLTVIL